MVPTADLPHDGINSTMIQKSEVSDDSLRAASLKSDIQLTTTKQPLATKSTENVDTKPVSVNGSNAYHDRVSNSKNYTEEKREKDKAHKHKKHKKHSDTKKHKSHKGHKHHIKHLLTDEEQRLSSHSTGPIDSSAEGTAEGSSKSFNNGVDHINDPKPLSIPNGGSQPTNRILISPSRSDAENITVDATAADTVSIKVSKLQFGADKDASGYSKSTVGVTEVRTLTTDDAATVNTKDVHEAVAKVEPVTINIATSSIVHKEQTGWYYKLFFKFHSIHI